MPLRAVERESEDLSNPPGIACSRRSNLSGAAVCSDLVSAKMAADSSGLTVTMLSFSTPTAVSPSPTSRPSTVHARLARAPCALLFWSHSGVAVTAVTTSAMPFSASAARHAAIRAGLFELPA